MITNVSDAKEKWCPFDLGQHSPREHQKGVCLGPDCMMWRFWVAPPGAELNPKETRTKHGIPDNQKKGYCGLAESH